MHVNVLYTISPSYQPQQRTFCETTHIQTSVNLNAKFQLT